ncbi:hypothetical protein BLOT_006435 [Blomia tropicalis]|nr:hypothetical protein BLOT_006435 [Blomia tropicalis]
MHPTGYMHKPKQKKECCHPSNTAICLQASIQYCDDSTPGLMGLFLAIFVLPLRWYTISCLPRNGTLCTTAVDWRPLSNDVGASFIHELNFILLFLLLPPVYAEICRYICLFYTHACHEWCCILIDSDYGITDLSFICII